MTQNTFSENHLESSTPEMSPQRSNQDSTVNKNPTLNPLQPQQQAKQGLGSNLKSARELAVLRANINLMADQLQDLLENEEAAATAARRLNQITSQVRDTTNKAELFAIATTEAREALQADRVIVYEFDPEWKGTVVAESVGRGYRTSLGDRINDPCFGDRYVQPYLRGRVSATEDIYQAGLTDCHIGQLEPYGVKANLVAPIVTEKQLYGLLIAHQCSNTRLWQETEIDFIKQLAIQIGYAIDRNSVLEQQATVAKQANLLNQIATNIRKSQDIEEIFGITVEESRNAIEADRVIIYKFDPEWKGTVVAESVGRGYKTSLGDNIDDPCFGDRYVQPYLRGRVSATENIYQAGLTDCHIGQLEPYGVKANLVVPILANKKLYGLLIAHQCSSTRQWKENEIDFFSQVGSQVGLALDRISLLKEQQAVADRANLLNKITASIGESFKFADIFSIAVCNTHEALGVDRVVVYKFDEQYRGTVVAESLTSGFPVALGDRINDPCFSDGYLRYYQQGRVKATDNIYEAGLIRCHIEELEPYEVKANLVAPILANKQLHGLFIAHQCSAPRKWKDNEIEFFKQIAVQIGFALDRALLLEKQKEAVKIAQQLNFITSRLWETLKVTNIFNSAVTETRSALKSDRVVVYKFDEQYRGTVVAESVESGFPVALGDRVNDPCFGDGYMNYYQKGRVKATENIYEAGFQECHVAELEPYQVKANLVAPILSNKKLHGLFIAHQCDAPRKWKESEIEFFKQIAVQIGFALDRAILLEKEQLAADRAKLLNVITVKIREVLDRERIFNLAVKETRKTLKVDRALIYSLHGELKDRIVAESSIKNLPEISDIQPELPEFLQDLLEQFEEGKEWIFNSAKKTATEDQNLEESQIKSGAIVPILANQKLYGLLAIHQCDTPRSWQPEEIDFLKQLAIQIAYAYEQSLVLEEAKKARARSEQLFKTQQQQAQTLRQEIRGFMKEIESTCDGNLTVRAKVNEGEMGTVADFFNATIESLQDLVIEVQSATLAVAKTVKESKNQVGTVSQEATRQADSIAASLLKIKNMAASIQGMAKDAQQAQIKVKEGNEIIVAGDRVMNEMVASIRNVQQTVDKTAKKVKRLGEASQNISSIVSLIGDFAKQTNILALNASIEVQSTVTEDGQDFGIIASEVRNLAEQSAEAAKEIEEIVAQIQTETSEAVNAMEVGRKQVNEGTLLVEKTRQQLGKVTNASEEIEKIVTNIARSATQEVQTSADLTNNIQEVAEIASNTSTQSKHLLNYFKQLLQVAVKLQENVSQFKVK